MRLSSAQRGLVMHVFFNRLDIITSICTQQELAEVDTDEETAKRKKKEETLNKFRAIGKMSRFYKTLSEEKTAVVKLKARDADSFFRRSFLFQFFFGYVARGDYQKIFLNLIHFFRAHSAGKIKKKNRPKRRFWALFEKF